MLLSACSNIGNFNCPEPIWPEDDIVEEFKKYPQNSNMHQFFMDYVWQQEKLELLK